jgi:tripartite-type tricarboxylate transporter receptor subunit TctC
MERTRRTLLAAGLAAIWPGSRAGAQPAWPAKPIRLIVPYPPGGHTIAYGNTSTPIINPSAYRRLPYDPMADFDAVS